MEAFLQDLLQNPVCSQSFIIQKLSSRIPSMSTCGDHSQIYREEKASITFDCPLWLATQLTIHSTMSISFKISGLVSWKLHLLSTSVVSKDVLRSSHSVLISSAQVPLPCLHTAHIDLATVNKNNRKKCLKICSISHLFVILFLLWPRNALRITKLNWISQQAFEKLIFSSTAFYSFLGAKVSMIFHPSPPWLFYKYPKLKLILAALFIHLAKGFH